MLYSRITKAVLLAVAFATLLWFTHDLVFDQRLLTEANAMTFGLGAIFLLFAGMGITLVMVNKQVVHTAVFYIGWALIVLSLVPLIWLLFVGTIYTGGLVISVVVPLVLAGLVVFPQRTPRVQDVEHEQMGLDDMMGQPTTEESPADEPTDVSPDEHHAEPPQEEEPNPEPSEPEYQYPEPEAQQEESPDESDLEPTAEMPQPEPDSDQEPSELEQQPVAATVSSDAELPRFPFYRVSPERVISMPYTEEHHLHQRVIGGVATDDQSELGGQRTFPEDYEDYRKD